MAKVSDDTGKEFVGLLKTMREGETTLVLTPASGWLVAGEAFANVGLDTLCVCGGAGWSWETGGLL